MLRTLPAARLVEVALTLVVFAVVPAIAQNRNAGEIRGTVSDSSGATVPAVAVAVTNTDTSVTTTFRTDATGTYDATPLVPGPYAVTFLKDGFQKYVRSNLFLHVETITVNAVLQVGSISEQVTVAAQGPLLQSESSERSLTLTSESATELPNVGRGWFNLIGQLPGTNGSATNSSINGTLPDSANWLADGGTATLPNSNNPDAIEVPLEAIGEIDINTSSFGAESGNGPAVFNVITKSGTNQFHGSLFEFVQNNVFNARNFFSPTVPPVRWNEFGGAIGGPIKKDKLFFFFAYQRNPNNSYSTGFYTYPTSAMRAGNFSGLGTIYDPSTTALVNGQYVRQAFPNNTIPTSRFDPVAQKILQYYPNPTLPGTFNNYFFSGANTATETWYNFRVDYNIASGNRLSVSGMAVPQTSFRNTPDCPLDCQNDNSPEYTGQITDVWTPKANLVNEFRTAVSRQAFDFTSPNQGEGFPQKLGLNNATADAFPNISVGGPVSLSGIGGGTAARTHQTAYVTSDSVSLLLGKHTLKFGGEYDKWENSTAWGSKDAGSFNFSGIFTRDPAVTSSQGQGVADLLLGLPQSWNTYVFEEYGSHDSNLQAFIQDYYKIRPNLTLNFGVRYMWQAGWTETYNRLSTFLPNSTNPISGTPGAIGFAGVSSPTAAENNINFFLQPRAGFAWSPWQDWVVRGGYGIFNLPWSATSYVGGMGVGWNVQGQEQVTDNITPIFTMAQGPPAALSPQNEPRTGSLLNGQQVTWQPYTIPMSYMQEYQFGIQHQISGYVFDLAYVGNQGKKLQWGVDLNQVPMNLLGPGNAQARRPYPQFSDIKTQTNSGFSNYNSLQFTSRKTFQNGLSYIFNYTWAKMMDVGSGSGTAGFGNFDYGDHYQYSYNAMLNYGPSVQDMPQMVNGSVIYDLPFGKGRQYLNRGGFLNEAVGGWQISTTYMFHSGTPFTPTVGTANLSGLQTSSGGWAWYPNVVGSPGLAHQSLSEWFNTAAFQAPAPYTLGDGGRGILYGPAFAVVNLGLAKSFAIPKFGERSLLHLRADATNIANHPSFGNPDASIGTTGAGRISSASAARAIQLGAVLRF